MKHTLVVATALLFFSTFASAAPSEEPQPNFLFIMVDDLNDWIGPMGGHPQAITPNIDRLAAEGVTFMNAHCPAPLCGPSRVALWTGRAPYTTGMYFQIEDEQIMDNLPEGVEAQFLPDLLEEDGYHTLGAGKIFHRGDRAEVFQNFGPGFNFGPRPENGMRLNFEPKWMGPAGTSTDWGAFPESEESMPDFAIREWAVEALQAEPESPFFMGVGFVRPHVPWYVPQEWFDLFDQAELETPPYLPNDLDDVPEISRLLHTVPGYPTTEWAQLADEWQAIVEAYLASVAFVDHQVGLVLDALEDSPYADNTYVFLMGDHGYHLGEKNRFLKLALWERSTKTPLIIAGPGIPKGIRSEEPVGLIDLYPTILDIAGVQAKTTLEGHSLLPLFSDDGAPEPWEYVAITTHGRNNHAIRSQDFRYIRYENGAEELYDHRSDPWEHHNLAGDPAYAEVIEEMKTHLPETNTPLVSDSLLITPFFRERDEDWRKP